MVPGQEAIHLNPRGDWATIRRKERDDPDQRGIAAVVTQALSMIIILVLVLVLVATIVL